MEIKTLLLTIPLLCSSLFLNAQKEVDRYFSLSTSSLFSIGGKTFEQGSNFGYKTAKAEFELRGQSKDKTAWGFGVQADGGFVLNKKLLVGAGIKLAKRIDQGVAYCDFCDFIYTHNLIATGGDPLGEMFPPPNLSSYFLEIPIRVQYNFLNEKKFHPYISSEVYWSKSFQLKSELGRNVNYVGYRAGGGIARNINSHQFSLEAKVNTHLFSLIDYPKYKMKEIELGLRWVKIF